MKKITCLLAFFSLVLISTTSFAQDAKFGLRLGINFSSISGDDADVFKEGSTGLIAGFYYDYIYTDKIGVEVGMLYSGLGAGTANDSSTLRIHYLEYPFLLKYYITPKLNIHAGPQFALTVGANFGDESEASDFISIAELSAAAGAEYKFDFGLVVGMRYRAGLTSAGATILDYNGINEIESRADLKNKALQLSLGYLF